MFGFFSKKTKDNMKKDGLDNTIDSSEMVSDEFKSAESDSDKEIYTSLYLHPSWKIDNEQKYVFSFLNNELQPLKPNQLSLSGIELFPNPKGIIVSAFVRSSLPKPIKLGEMPLLLLDSNNEIIAKHVFDGEKLGEIPAESSMPWHFSFPKESMKKTDFEKENWTLAFNLAYSKHRLDLEESWEQSLPQEEKEKLKKLVSQLPKLKDNELNLTGIQAKVLDNGDLQVTVLIRNGHEKNIQIDQLPLKVTDAQGDVLVEGGFSLNNFVVKANTSKPWTFIFPNSLLKKDIINLSKWSISIVQ